MALAASRQRDARPHVRWRRDACTVVGGAACTVRVVAVAGGRPDRFAYSTDRPTELHGSYVEYDPEFVFGGSVADLQVGGPSSGACHRPA
jgi:hypothetical protein